MKSWIWTAAAVLMLPLLLAGCRINSQVRYHTIDLHIEAQGDATMVIATHDRRPYVLSGEKDAAYTGTLRNSAGSVFDARTETNQPLAYDLTRIMAASLKTRGFSPNPVVIDPHLTTEKIVAQMEASGSDKLLLLEVMEWRTDTFASTALYYDLTLKIHDAQGRPLAQARTMGQEDLGADGWDPVSHARKAAPLALAKRMEKLFNQPQIIQVLE